MPFIKNVNYCDLPFSCETSRTEFYTYSSVTDLLIESYKVEANHFRCRTIGILESINGSFYISDISQPMKNTYENKIRVSMIYLQSSPPSTLMPYPIQVFGSVYCKSKPVIYARIIQVMSTAMAIRLKNAMTAVSKSHLAKVKDEEEHIQEDIPTNGIL